MAFNELVVRALGEDRVRRMTEGTQKLVDKAEAAPRCTDSFVHLTIPLSAKDPDAADRELGELLARSDPNADWSYFTLRDADGRGFARASPFLRQTAQPGSTEWLITFTFSDLYVRLGAWWLTQLWRGAELATGARDGLEQWHVLVVAACGRSLLEGAAYLDAEVSKLIEMWDAFKRSGVPTADTLDDFARELNERVTTLQYASRVGQGTEQPPQVPSTNVMTYLDKLAKRATDFDVIETYQWLCDAVHPSFGSSTTYCVVRLRDSARSHLLERHARHPLDDRASNPQAFTPTVAQRAADAIILATDLLDQDLVRVRWVLDDVGLTTQIADSLPLKLLDFPLAHQHPERNSACPCGSGRKFKHCVHRWGQPGIPAADEPNRVVTGPQCQ